MEIKNVDFNFKEMGRRIHNRRKEKGYTQGKLSDITGISPSQISSAENGSRMLSIEALIAICAALDASPDYFLLGINHKYNMPKNIEETMKLLSVGDMEFIMKIANILIERNKEGNIAQEYLDSIPEIIKKK